MPNSKKDKCLKNLILDVYDDIGRTSKSEWTQVSKTKVGHFKNDTIREFYHKISGKTYSYYSHYNDPNTYDVLEKDMIFCIIDTGGGFVLHVNPVTYWEREKIAHSHQVDYMLEAMYNISLDEIGDEVCENTISLEIPPEDAKDILEKAGLVESDEFKQHMTY